MKSANWKILAVAGALAAPVMMAGCTTSKSVDAGKTAKGAVARTSSAQSSGYTSYGYTAGGKKTYAYTARDKECLKRAMYFESNRSSKDGFLAVGTVVMNRLVSGKYPDTICGVVGQKNQFAPGVLSRQLKSVPEIDTAADAVLKGERHPKVRNAMFFHTAGLKFPYRNMHYVLVAGGNAFYEKRRRDGTLETPVLEAPRLIAAADVLNPPAAMPAETRPQAVPVPAANPIDRTVVASIAPGEGFGPRAKGDRVTRDATARYETVAWQTGTAPVRAETSRVSTQTELGYDSSRKPVDAIGELLLSQDRPEPVY
ncbi:spore germination cell wall hydrolase CwlJ-like protein [Phyllobacterium leguminum]|uniref:Spore germination cell wall hydrolase CwlJ-like protein n=1 Tax=Phyllobacterium leguminum TaxID=314237 RepID=A0A318T7N9_9HYPH|nr:spore germination cell wall hydrolase CwlJ-like protein [Phyllobacterium leguminum]